MLFFIGVNPEVPAAGRPFKYISCYSLSTAYLGNQGIGIRFKYISCYSLSGEREESKCSESNLNTSHVILYPKRRNKREGNGSDLNTSHVILYHFLAQSLGRILRI